MLPQQEKAWFKSVTTTLGANPMEKIHSLRRRNFSVPLYKLLKLSPAWGHSLALGKKEKSNWGWGVGEH